MFFHSKAKVRIEEKYNSSTDILGGESEQTVVPSDVQANGNNIEQHSSQSASSSSGKKTNQIPKIWMDFDDFCTCFTSIIVFHNPRGYQYNHKHTEIKVT